MKRASKIFHAASAAAWVLLFLVSCSVPSGTDSGGVLVIRLSGARPRATLVPDESLEIVSIEISGSGPAGASFALPPIAPDAGSTGRQYLAVGTWSVTALGKNNADTVVASGSTTVEIVSGQEAHASLLLTPLSGDGSVSISASWPGGIVASPAVSAELSPVSGGSEVPLAATLETASGVSASLDNAAVPAGSYLLTVRLLDGASEVGRGVGAVLVAAGMSTSGTLDFLYDPEQGALAIDLDIGLSTPIPIALEAGLATLEQGASTSVVAVSPETGINEYRWYVNGVRQAGQGSGTLLFGSGRGVGTYRIDLLAFRAERVGAASAIVQVIRPRAAAVSFSPAPGAVDSGTYITMTTATVGALIRYTTDGSEPTAASTMYDPAERPLLNANATFKAKAFAAGFSESLVATASYVALGPTDAVYVSATGNDANPGTAAEPKLTVLAALELAQVNGAPEVRVAAGTYRIAAKYGAPITTSVALKGGYNAADWEDRAYRSAADRADARYRTTLVYDYPFNGTSWADSTRILDIYDPDPDDGRAVAPIIEGFTILPKANGAFATGIRARGFSAPELRHCTVRLEAAAGNGGYGVYATDASLEVADSTLQDLSSSAGGGESWMVVAGVTEGGGRNFSVSVLRNSFTSTSNLYGGAVRLGDAGTGRLEATVVGNTMTANSQHVTTGVQLAGWGRIEGNTMDLTGVPSYARAIWVESARDKDLAIEANTILLNSHGGHLSSYAIYVQGGGAKTDIVGNYLSNLRLSSDGMVITVHAGGVRSIVQNVLVTRHASDAGYGHATGINGPADLIANNTIRLSSALNVALYGLSAFDGESRIVNNIIALESPDRNDGGINDNGGSPLELRNNAFVMDPGPAGWYYYDNQGGYGAVNDVRFINDWDVTTQSPGRPSSGNIALDPATTTLFAEAAVGNLRLAAGAPVSVAGGGRDISAEPLWPRDIGGQPVDADGTARTAPWSLGAYERD